MIARFALAAALLASAPVVQGAAVPDQTPCGAANQEEPRCSLPSLPRERLPLLTCHTLPVTDAGQMVRLSRGTSIFDVQAEVFTVNADVSTTALTAQYDVVVDDHSTLDKFDTEYTAAGFYFHELVELENSEGQAGISSYHVITGGLDAELDCWPTAGR